MRADPPSRGGLPRAAVVGAAILVLGSIALAALARPGIDPVGAQALGSEPRTRRLAFEDRDDGGVLVIDATTADTIRIIPPGAGGFIRGALRALIRARTLRTLRGPAAFVLEETPSGRLILSDAATGTAVELEAFGPTNVAAFRAFLEPLSAGPLSAP